MDEKNALVVHPDVVSFENFTSVLIRNGKPCGKNIVMKIVDKSATINGNLLLHLFWRKFCYK